MQRTRPLLGRRIRALLLPYRALALARWVRDVFGAIRRRRRERRRALTVAVDAASLFEPLTGIGGYLYHLLRELAGRDDLHLRLYGPESVALPGGMEPSVPLPEGPAVEWVRRPAPPAGVPGAGTLRRWLTRLEPILTAADGNRVLFAPNYLAPPQFRLSRAPLAAVVHDLSIEKVPWAVRPDSRDALTERLARTFRDARTVITDTEAVRGEILAAGHMPADRVVAIHLGPGLASPGPPPRDGIPAAPAQPAGAAAEPLPHPYGLAVGTLEPRKNLVPLLAAWKELRETLSRDPGAKPPTLVLVGRFGWKSEELRREVAAGTEEGWLVHRGYLPDGELLRLYRGASLVAFPTLYEGFGFPAVEAMASGAPLVASDLPVLREVAGDAALYVPPSDVPAWAAALARVLTEPGLAADLRRLGAIRVASFSWERTARETLAVWRSLE